MQKLGEEVSGKDAAGAVCRDSSLTVTELADRFECRCKQGMLFEETDSRIRKCLWNPYDLFLVYVLLALADGDTQNRSTQVSGR